MSENPRVLVGQSAPDFTVPAVLGSGEIVENFNFAKSTANQYALIFFYPLDFTFVCPSELIALNKRMDKFRELGVEVIAVSIDSHFTHNAWRNTSINDGGIGEVQYTMAADLNHDICRAYGVEADGGVAFRGAFVIDRQGLVRAQIVNDLPLGRNIDEIVRTFEALQFHEQHGEVCPAGWQQGRSGMTASPAGVANYLAEYAEEL